MSVAAGFTGSQIGTDEANDKNEEEVQAEQTPAEAESTDPTPAENAGTTGSTTESSPEEQSDGTKADLAEGDEFDAEEHADVRLHDEGDGPATSGVREAGSVEYGA